MQSADSPNQEPHQAGCGTTCSSEKGRGVLEKLGQPEQSEVKHAICVMSGKGGVGKSTVAALVAAALAKEGLSVGVLDADITGPSIPKLFGVKEAPASAGIGMIPPKTSLGIEIMSLNLLLSHEEDPVIWRGPLLAGAAKQFWSDVIWGELDYMVVDLPPGTGDVPLTVLQSLPIDGIIIVSSPQDLAMMVVTKAIRMARMLKVPIVGLVENMSYVRCPNCEEKIELFGHSTAEDICQREGVRFLGSLPLDPELSRLGDQGKIEEYNADFLKMIPSFFG
jgi:Mrp family chromosome partitioning ATPase